MFGDIPDLHPSIYPYRLSYTGAQGSLELNPGNSGKSGHKLGNTLDEVLTLYGAKSYTLTHTDNSEMPVRI